MVGEKLVPLALVMAARFGEHVLVSRLAMLRKSRFGQELFRIAQRRVRSGVFRSGMNGLLAELRPLLLAE